VWITGNHDESLADSALPGVVEDELCVGGIALRHIAVPGSAEPELSGHFHPKLRLSVRGRFIARPCAVRGGNRMILPAHGALTGDGCARPGPARGAGPGRSAGGTGGGGRQGTALSSGGVTGPENIALPLP
jgi:hypothetical protein